MSTFEHRNNIITRSRQASTKLLAATAELEACAAAWNRGISTEIIDATGTNPTAEGYKANDFRGP